MLYPVLFGQIPEVVEECVSPFFDKNDFALNCGTALSQQMANAWDESWTLFIGEPSQIYIALVNIGRLFALLSLGFFMYKFLRAALADESYDAMSQLVWPLVVVILLSNDASLLRQTSTTMRALINQTNAQVLEIANASLVYETHLNEVLDYGNAEKAIRDVRAQCNGMTNNEQLIACLEQGHQQATAIVDGFNVRYGTTVWGNRLTNLVKTAISDLRDNPLLAANLKGAVVNPLISLAIEAFLAALQNAFHYLVELSFILTAMLGPIALGLTLSPLGGIALYAWIISFLSVGLAKLCFNVVTAMLVTMIYQAGPLDPMVNMILLGLLAPVLSFAMAAGGGMAVFNGVLATVQQLTFGIASFGISSYIYPGGKS